MEFGEWFVGCGGGFVEGEGWYEVFGRDVVVVLVYVVVRYLCGCYDWDWGIW